MNSEKGDESSQKTIMFDSLGIIKPIMSALDEKGYKSPTEIQAAAIPEILAGRDILGCAQTGTGKTAAFAIPVIQMLAGQKPPGKKRKIRCLILSPTRELASQIGDNVRTYSKNLKMYSTVIYGGMKQYPQVNTLRKGVDILVATPGRLLDLMDQGHISLSNVEHFILDEVDQMLDMGFIHDIKKILGHIPENRQSLFFCATMPPEIVKLAGKILHKPVEIIVNPVSSTADKVEQFVYHVRKDNKDELLLQLLNDNDIASALVFTRTKINADKVVKLLRKYEIKAEAIHSDISQGSRQRALSNFKKRSTRILVATDIAARGIDVSNLEHVINYEFSDSAEAYIHRIGRTGRAGMNGTAYSFCDNYERKTLYAVEKIISKKLEVVEDHPFAIPHREHKPKPAGRKGGFKKEYSKSYGKKKPGRGFKSKRAAF
jgi:ATP-dependent RNA helicase RhlE